jgi:hypothetical protein
MESSKSTKAKKPLIVEEEDLVDRDKDVFDPILSFDSFEIHQLAIQNFRDLVDHYHAWESDLEKFLVPQVYEFPEFVVWCASNYIPSKRVVISKHGSVLIEINPQSISEMLRWPLNPDSEMLDETVLAKCFRELNSQDRVTLLQSYLCQNLDVPADNVTLKASLFPEISRQIISMISVILGKDDDQLLMNLF